MNEYAWSRANGWTGDLRDNHYLYRYGMTAHVEKMDEGCWWFAVSVDNPREPPPLYDYLYNSSDRASNSHITSGVQARRAAEEVMECLREHNLNHWPEPLTISPETIAEWFKVPGVSEALRRAADDGLIYSGTGAEPLRGGLKPKA